MMPAPSCFWSSCWTAQKSSSVKYPRPIPLWFVTIMSLKPAFFSLGSNSLTPSRSSTSSGREQYPTSFISVPSRSRKIAFCLAGFTMHLYHENSPEAPPELALLFLTCPQPHCWHDSKSRLLQSPKHPKPRRASRAQSLCRLHLRDRTLREHETGYETAVCLDQKESSLVLQGSLTGGWDSTFEVTRRLQAAVDDRLKGPNQVRARVGSRRQKPHCDLVSRL